MYIKNSEYLSKFTGAEIDDAIEHMQSIDLDFDKKVDKTQTINGQELTGDITITAEDVGAPLLDDIGNGTVTFIQNGVEKGSITMNQKEDATIELNGGGSGGSSTLSGLDDVSLSSPTTGQALIYDSNEQKWKNGDASSVVFIDWTS